MITVHWVCNVCGASGKKMIQFCTSTPYDVTDEEVAQAKALALAQVDHEHKQLTIVTTKG